MSRIVPRFVFKQAVYTPSASGIAARASFTSIKPEPASTSAEATAEAIDFSDPNNVF
jgi:hypothetical protein